MWVTRHHYEELVQQSAKALALVDELQRVRALLAQQIERADRAVDAALMSKNIGPITPLPPPPVEKALFDDDPDELREMMKTYKHNPLEVLFQEGKGDAK